MNAAMQAQVEKDQREIDVRHVFAAACPGGQIVAPELIDQQRQVLQRPDDDEPHPTDRGNRDPIGKVVRPFERGAKVQVHPHQPTE